MRIGIQHLFGTSPHDLLTISTNNFDTFNLLHTLRSSIQAIRCYSTFANNVGTRHWIAIGTTLWRHGLSWHRHTGRQNQKLRSGIYSKQNPKSISTSLFSYGRYEGAQQ